MAPLRKALPLGIGVALLAGTAALLIPRPAPVVPAELRFVERVAIAARWECDGSVDCPGPYAGMKPALARGDRDADDLRQQFQRAIVGEVEPLVPANPAALREAILEATGGGVALAAVASTEVRVAQRRRTEQPDWTDVNLLFEEPLLGGWDAVLRIPHGDGPFPAAIGLHGHGDSPEWMLERPGARELTRRGFVVVVPRLRLFKDRDAESRVSWEFLRSGTSVMATRLAEGVLILEWLRRRPDVDPDRVGLVSHSGGGGLAALLPRVTDGIDFVLMDLETDFDSWNPEFDRIAEETVPGLVPWREAIHDPGTLSALRVVYDGDVDDVSAPVGQIVERWAPP